MAQEVFSSVLSEGDWDWIGSMSVISWRMPNCGWKGKRDGGGENGEMVDWR